MERIPKRIHARQFREQTVRLHEVDDLTVPEVAKQVLFSDRGIVVRQPEYRP